MSEQACILTHEGYLNVEIGIPLEELNIGDRVLGTPSAVEPNAARTVYTITATLGQHHIPTEDPTLIERLLVRLGAERVFAGAKVEGVLVQGAHNPGLFALGDTPRLDRIIL